jgi:hypothetical protein
MPNVALVLRSVPVDAPSSLSGVVWTVRVLLTRSKLASFALALLTARWVSGARREIALPLVMLVSRR